MDVAVAVDLIDYDRPAFYDRLQRARVNASFRPLQLANGVIGLVGAIVAVTAVGITLILIEPLIVLLVVIGGVPSLLLNRASSRVLHDFAVRQTPNDRRRAYLYQTLTRKEEAHEIRAFDSGGYLRREHDRLYDERIVDHRTTVRRRLFLGALSGLIASAVTLGAVVMLLAFVGIGRISAADAAVALGAVVVVASQIRGLIGSTGSLYEGALFLEDFTGFVAKAPPKPRRTEPRPVRADSPVGFDRIELDDVSFTYPSRREASLHNVSLTIKAGEIIAIVGENGSGKTTLTKLLAGLYRPTEGTVTWDGRDTRGMDLAHLRENATVIFQDFAKYYLSAHENIGISRIEDMEDRGRIRHAAERAGAEAFLATLPGGYGCLLGPSFSGGTDLSVGQWQRVALARAYFRDAPMLILDEPTAAVDPRGEYEIFQQVRRLASGRTVILVSHRFSTVRVADRIVVLQGGRIVEEGDHATLEAADGLYAELFRLQAEGYRA
jgi:ATP-binding cassette, subfamily B, bacterial